MNWLSFFLGVGAVVVLGILSIPVMFIYRWTCTDWETGAFVAPRWWKRLKGERE